ncbi:MAG: NAD(P)H-dependent oxidoreductase subunit E [Nitrospira bacterium HGW-Nitrospira-1]|nr:MAG: NAD(P)H-dependent oxidoreductase subunit E [Nitrospira bacterium HGW-Nitrospira-1]
MFNETVLKEIKQISGKYPTTRAALLPALYVAQREFGHLGADAYEAVSDVLGVPKAIARGVGTFYAMYKHKPMGRHIVQLCTNVSCMILGAEKLSDFLKNKYGLEPGGITPDGRFSLVIMECIGACGTAPAMLVNDDFYENLTEKYIEEILEKYK